MAPLSRALLFTLLVVASAGCQRAARYAAPAVEEKSKPAPLTPDMTWLPAVKEPRDMAIVFVPETSPRWAGLARRFNNYPPPAAGTRTAHLGLLPLQALAAFVLTEGADVLEIKVPRGLPDPTPFIPAVNAPTVGRLRLGARLFQEQSLRGRDGYTYACATCHRPGESFCETGAAHPPRAERNTPSLVNAVYNRSQFWDGRVHTLEETLVQTLADERPDEQPVGRDPAVTHRWGGLVEAVRGQPAYRKEFELVFGIEEPTQDAIAKSLATYVRTLLGGDSLVDRAEAACRHTGAEKLAPEHFLPEIEEALPEFLRKTDPKTEKRSREQVARALALGHRLFHGKARCASCHPAPLYTDHDFHNVGLIGRDSDPPKGVETGRSVSIPIGLKENRLVGAYRTPTLRGLRGTHPYFHDGTHATVRQVVEFFDREVWDNPHLAVVLRDGDRARTLQLDADEVDALVLYLLALEGTPAETP